MGADPQPGLQAKVAGSFFSLYSTVLRLSVASTKFYFGQCRQPGDPQYSCFFFIFIHFHLAVSSLSYGTWDLCSVLWPLSLRCAGSAVVVCELGCPSACGLLVP